jgi:uncharacterized membrane protein
MLAAGALALAGALAPATAYADLTFCNQTWKQILVNFVEETAACSIGWGGYGWYYVNPGSCTAVSIGPLPERYYYYRADSTDGAWHWTSNNWYWWMPNAAHSAWCVNYAQSSGGRYYNHRQLDTGSYSSYTVNLTTSVPNPCRSGCYPSASDVCVCSVP